MKNLTLYTVPKSRGMSVVWMLKECGATFDTVLLSFNDTTQSSDHLTVKSADYLAINPMGKVPALKAGDAVITEAAAILTFLAEQFPERNLIPAAGSLARGEYYRWLCFAINTAGSASPSIWNTPRLTAAIKPPAMPNGTNASATVTATPPSVCCATIWRGTTLSSASNFPRWISTTPCC